MNRKGNKTMSPNLESSNPSRRQFIASTGLTTMAVGAGALTSHALAVNAQPAVAKAPSRSRDTRYNILFILTDQERYFDPAKLPNGYSLPGRERMRREGVSFVNHQIATSVCSSSRSVIYTGQHIQQTGVFDNLGFPWSKQLSHETPTFGQYLAKAGYHPAYLGKCHMVDALEEVEVENAPTVSMDELSKVMQSYGFEDYVGVGDIIGSTMGGYKSDEFTTSTAVRWLRTQAPKLENEGKPWFLALNLVNPHDVMYFNTDAPGAEPVQDNNLLFDVNLAPDHALYQRPWDMPLPESRKEPWEHPGRPRAHYDFQYARMALVGQFPNEDARWKRLQDYYLNCIADRCRIHAKGDRSQAEWSRS